MECEDVTKNHESGQTWWCLAGKTEPREERLEWPFKPAARALGTVLKHRSGCGACVFGKERESCSPRFLIYNKGDSGSRLGAFEKHFCLINLFIHRRLCRQLIVSRRVEVWEVGVPGTPCLHCLVPTKQFLSSMPRLMLPNVSFKGQLGFSVAPAHTA